MVQKEHYRIYTKGGDSGETSLPGMRRVRKDDLRIEVCGTLDELNAHVGLLLAGEVPEEDQKLLRDVQHRLFDIGLAVSAGTGDSGAQTGMQEDTRKLEGVIDRLQEQVPMPQGFILPGGGASAATCHLCRTVCRRAERRLCTLAASEPVPEGLLAYVNRLSDYLFVLSLKLNFIQGKHEILWRKRC